VALARGAYVTGRAAYGGAAELELGAQTFWLRLEAGRLADDGPRLYAALERYPGLPAARCALARIDAELGRLERAAGTLAQLTGPALDAMRREAGWPISAALLAEVCARVGDEAAARRLATATAPAADRWATSAFGSLCLGPLSGSLALVCAVAGSWEEAERWYEHALAGCAAAGAAPAAARLTREFERLAEAPISTPAAPRLRR
jgi:tetratricopeptide (TPR) repeat protein